MNKKYSLAIHGGAGTLKPDQYSEQSLKEHTDVLRQSLTQAEEILKDSGSALDAVQTAILVMENSPFFNAGLGSVFDEAGGHELDAAIMDGLTGKAGAVAAAKLIKNPIKAARLILESSPHVLIAGEGADIFAKNRQLDVVENSYFSTEKRRQQWEKARESHQVVLDHTGMKLGTVGAVAMDRQGNLAAATSTGGLTNKQLGRISDSAIIGAGTYAENGVVAISCTGTGDLFIQQVTAKEMANLIKYQDIDLNKAGEKVLSQIKSAGGEGGLIAINSQGEIALPFVSVGMFRGSVKEGEGIQVAVFS